MIIGIIGLGVVGSAIQKGFQELEHEVLVHDIKLDTSIDGVLSAELIYLCLPTPSSEDGRCDTSILKKVIKQLKSKKYEGIVAVKSTIIPGTYKELSEIFDKDRLILVPEFLREKFAYEDFTTRHNVLVIGTNNLKNVSPVLVSHGDYPKAIKIISPEECEFVKYFSNVFKAYKTLFANSFGVLCDKHNVDYSKILDVYEAENVKETSYLRYMGGFAGMCLPKDTKALAKLAKNTEVETFNFLLEENKKYI